MLLDTLLLFPTFVPTIPFNTSDVLVSSRITVKRPDTQRTLICNTANFTLPRLSKTGLQACQLLILRPRCHADPHSPFKHHNRLLGVSSVALPAFAIVLPRPRFSALTSPMIETSCFSFISVFFVPDGGAGSFPFHYPRPCVPVSSFQC